MGPLAIPSRVELQGMRQTARSPGATPTSTTSAIVGNTLLGHFLAYKSPLQGGKVTMDMIQLVSQNL